MFSSFSNLTEFFCAIPGEGFRFGDPCIDPALLCVPTRDTTFETTVARVQLPVGPQNQLSTYEVKHRHVFHDPN